MNNIHYSVLLNESIELLNIKPDGIYVDATLGLGGHSEEILKSLDSGHLYSFDQDKAAIKLAKERLQKYDNFTIINQNFSSLKVSLNELGVRKIDGILFDLGVSSLQFDQDDRGFSYRFDAKLDMRMNSQASLSAYDIVNDYDYEQLVEILFKYGDEKYARKIAKNIVTYRNNKAIETTHELVDIIKNSMPQKALRKKGHPAKKTFQAIRIEVNDELNALKSALEQAVELLNVGGRIALISFQSLEDKLAKSYFNSLINIDYPKDVEVVLDEYKPILKKITRKNVKPSSLELDENLRSRSAQLRVVEKEREL